MSWVNDMDKRVSCFECIAPVTLYRSAMSDAQWQYICHKFQVPVDSQKVRSIKIESTENMKKETIDITYEWSP